MSDNVNHPQHYVGFSNGAEVIDITENLSFNLGNVVKYVARAGRKTADPTEDLSKARFYLERELGRLRLSEIVDELPKGLEYDDHNLFLDKDSYLWKWDGEKWSYFDLGDEEWIDVKGPPSKIYEPFRKVDLWLNA